VHNETAIVSESFAAFLAKKTDFAKREIAYLHEKFGRQAKQVESMNVSQIGSEI